MERRHHHHSHGKPASGAFCHGNAEVAQANPEPPHEVEERQADVDHEDQEPDSTIGRRQGREPRKSAALPVADRCEPAALASEPLLGWRELQVREEAP